MTTKTLFVFVVMIVTATFGYSAPLNTSSNWKDLERQLYQDPQFILEQLQQTEISSWPDRQLVNYYDLLTEANLVFSDYDSARKSHKKAWLLKELAEPYTLVNLLTTKAYLKELEGDDSSAEADYLLALRVAEESGSIDATLVALNSLIIFYSFTKDEYDLALEYIQRGSSIAPKATRHFLIGNLHTYYGNLLSYLSNIDGAFNQYRVAEDIYRQVNDQVSLSNLLYNKAMLYEQADDLISALRTYQNFIEQAESWGDPTAQFFGNMGIANSYSYLERYDQAYQSILAAEKAMSYIADSIYHFDFWVSVIYIAADVEDYELAEKALVESTKLLRQITDLELSWYHSNLKDAQKYLAVSQGDYEVAFNFSEEIRDIELQLLEVEQEEVLTQMRINSGNAMYQSETDRLATENRKQQRIIADKSQLLNVALVVMGILVVGLVSLIISVQKKARQMRELQQYSAISESGSSSGLRVMESVAGLLFDQSERRNSPLSVMIFEFTSLSVIQEKHGEQAVEAAMKWIHEILESEMRTEDKIGQMSFDRFMLLVPGAEVRVARKQADRVLLQFRDSSVPGWPNIKLEASVGISQRSRHDGNPNLMTHRATTAVDIARDTGIFSIKILAV